MIIVGANMGVSRMTREHIGIAFSLRIPFFVVLTKIDICPGNIYKQTMQKLMKVLKSQKLKRKPVVVKSDKEIVFCAKTMKTNAVCPVFAVSNVTGKGLEKVTKFLSLIKNRVKMNKLIKEADAPIEYDIHENFLVPGVGLVVSGIMKAGKAKLNNKLLLGPDKNKKFRAVVIKSIHINRKGVDEVEAGSSAVLTYDL